jgi:hypothetical protein
MVSTKYMGRRRPGLYRGTYIHHTTMLVRTPGILHRNVPPSSSTTTDPYLVLARILTTSALHTLNSLLALVAAPFP